MRYRIFLFIGLIALFLSGCATTTGLTAADVDVLRNSSNDGVLLLSTGRLERQLPYFPVVYYKVLSVDRQTGKASVVTDLKSEVMDLRYFNGSHFSGAGKQAVVHVVKIPAGTYWLAGYERDRTGYLPIAGGGGVIVPLGAQSKVRILYRVEVFAGKLTYGGELIVNSDDLGSNSSVTVSDEFERDIAFVAREHPYIKNLEQRKSIAVRQE